jgi:hypothetical protein
MLNVTKNTSQFEEATLNVSYGFVATTVNIVLNTTLNASNFTAKLGNTSMALSGSTFSLTSTELNPFTNNMSFTLTYKDLSIPQMNTYLLITLATVNNFTIPI